MKGSKFLFLVMMMLIAAVSQAQTKIGYVAYAELVDSLSSKSKVEQVLKAYEQQFVKGFQDIGNDFVNTTRNTDHKSPAELKKLEDELTAVQNKLRQYQDDAQKQMQAKREQLIKPLKDSIKLAVNQLAKAWGYDIVLDSSQQKLLVAPPEDDLTPVVKLKLGIK